MRSVVEIIYKTVTLSQVVLVSGYTLYVYGLEDGDCHRF